MKKMQEGGRPYKAVAHDCGCEKLEQNSIPSRNMVNENKLRILKQAKIEF